MQSKPGGHRPLAPQLSQGSHHSISATPTAAATSPVISSSAVKHDQCHRSVRARATRTFFFLSLVPPATGTLSCSLPVQEWRSRPARLRPGPSDRDARQKTTTRGSTGRRRAWLPSSPQPWDTSVPRIVLRGLRNSLHQFRCSGPPESVTSEAPSTFHSARVQPCCSA